MHELRSLLEDLAYARQRTEARGASFDFDGLEQLATRRRDAIQAFESLRAEQRTASGQMKGLKPGSDAFNETRATLKEMSDRIKQLDADRKAIDAEIDGLLLTLPNLLDDRVPAGLDEADNRLVETVGEPKAFAFDARDHVDVGEGAGGLDFEAAARVAGSRFAFLRGKVARLERALVNYMLDLHTGEHGYEEIAAPLLVNAEAMTGTGQLPKFEEDLFRLAGEQPYYLIPTAEVPVTNYYRDQLLEAYPGRVRFCAFTPCFRAEAGSHGRDTRGLIRQHQFNKVELVQFCHPDEGEAAHEELTGHARTVLDQLELPYRVMELCGGDVGFSAARCYDLEVWLPGQGAYREISSCSYFGDFQARRAGIRFRDEDGKPRFFHTLNGSGLAAGRTLVAVLENFQNADGSVTIPDVLRPYTGFERIEATSVNADG